MSDFSYVEAFAVVEGQTEDVFVKKILAPYLATRNVYLNSTLCGPQRGQGGNVKFERFVSGVGNFLKQRSGTFVTIIVDYYGVNSKWPGYLESQSCGDYVQKSRVFCEKTQQAVDAELGDALGKRFIPYVSMHEFEALLFSDVGILADELGVDAKAVREILDAYDSPEEINNSATTSPAKRLDKLSKNGRFMKTITGIKIAERISVDKMRERCKLFDEWVAKLENLAKYV